MSDCIPKDKGDTQLIHVEFVAISYILVFLGGSCNPTTWRKHTAIPHLEKNGISYYNPVSKHMDISAYHVYVPPASG